MEKRGEKLLKKSVDIRISNLKKKIKFIPILYVAFLIYIYEFQKNLYKLSKTKKKLTKKTKQNCVNLNI